MSLQKKKSRIVWKDSFLPGAYLFEIIAHGPGCQWSVVAFSIAVSDIVAGFFCKTW